MVSESYRAPLLQGKERKICGPQYESGQVGQVEMHRQAHHWREPAEGASF